ncbi:hypothetical protein K502DRAFT_325436 [Neoconidiobolus thromboides FSU 785]|nr:hypothetical protein K502DRAFT_325436 [Neoconidiobolus thromboides FSU 785]
MLCKRCHVEYKQEENKPDSCRFHSDLFVCRPHPADHYVYEIDDSKLDEMKDWEAKFWDCCGREDEYAEGCKTSFHVPY